MPTSSNQHSHAGGAPADPLIGRTVSGYRLLSVIGQGGMGTVYRAVQPSVGREVAIKVLRAEIAADPAVRARFAVEARSLGRVATARAATVFDFGETEDGLLFIAMELLQGETLDARLRRDGALPPREALHIAGEIARALTTAHDVGVVHRDLKPENVFLDRRDGLVKVLDFGIAKILDDGGESAPAGRALTAVGSIIGTPLYMSPEAASRRGGVGKPSDLYSLGVVLFEMLAGAPPFDEQEPVLLIGMHLKAPPPMLREVRADLEIPDELEQLIAELLAKKPAERPPSAAAVAARLDEIAAMLSPRAEPSARSISGVVRTREPLPTPALAGVAEEPSLAAHDRPHEAHAAPARGKRRSLVIAAAALSAFALAALLVTAVAWLWPSSDAIPANAAVPPPASEPPPPPDIPAGEDGPRIEEAAPAPLDEARQPVVAADTELRSAEPAIAPSERPPASRTRGTFERSSASQPAQVPRALAPTPPTASRERVREPDRPGAGSTSAARRRLVVD